MGTLLSEDFSLRRLFFTIASRNLHVFLSRKLACSRKDCTGKPCSNKYMLGCPTEVKSGPAEWKDLRWTFQEIHTVLPSLIPSSGRLFLFTGSLRGPFSMETFPFYGPLRWAFSIQILPLTVSLQGLFPMETLPVYGLFTGSLRPGLFLIESYIFPFNRLFTVDFRYGTMETFPLYRDSKEALFFF